MPANNLRNLFEMPVLFLALVPLLLITQMASDIQVGMAWIFVALRIVHSIIHVRKGSVAWRFRVYLLSCVVLLSMWIGFATDFATRSEEHTSELQSTMRISYAVL